MAARRPVPAGVTRGLPAAARPGVDGRAAAPAPGERVYPFWEYTRGAWGRDAGLRIDHLLLNPAAAQRLAAAGVDRDVRGWEKTSDHAPTWVELRGAQRALRPQPATKRNVTESRRRSVRVFVARGVGEIAEYAWLPERLRLSVCTPAIPR